MEEERGKMAGLLQRGEGGRIICGEFKFRATVRGCKPLGRQFHKASVVHLTFAL